MKATVLGAMALACPALAWEKELAAGDPAWTLTNLHADKVEVTIWHVGGPFASVELTVTPVYNDQKREYKLPANCRAPQAAHVTLHEPDGYVNAVGFKCLVGQVKIRAVASGRAY